MRFQRRYKKDHLQKAYQNACECILAGKEKDSWDDNGIAENLKNTIWSAAATDMKVYEYAV